MENYLQETILMLHIIRDASQGITLTFQTNYARSILIRVSKANKEEEKLAKDNNDVWGDQESREGEEKKKHSLLFLVL